VNTPGAEAAQPPKGSAARATLRVALCYSGPRVPVQNQCGDDAFVGIRNFWTEQLRREQSSRNGCRVSVRCGYWSPLHSRSRVHGQRRPREQALMRRREFTRGFSPWILRSRTSTRCLRLLLP